MSTSVALYQIAAEFRADAAKLADLDLDDDTLKDTLESLSGELEVKAVNVGKFIKGLEVTVTAMKSAEKALKVRRESAENRLERITTYLKDNMVACGILKIEGPDLKLAVRTNPGSLVIDDLGEIDIGFFTVPPQPEPELYWLRYPDGRSFTIPGKSMTPIYMEWLVQDGAQVSPMVFAPPPPAPALDNAALKKAISDGAAVNGARVVKSTRLEIRA